MEFEKIHNKGQARLFNNHYVEYLTKTHPLVIWGLYSPVLILLPYYASTFSVDPMRIFWLFMGGMFFWSFFEYLMHRFIFHFIAESPKTTQLIYVLHGNHHEYPRDKERLFMPAVPSLIISSFIFMMMYFIMGRDSFSFFPGFMFGYLIYGSMHYAIHAWNPPFKWMKGLWRNHHLHHYKQQQKGLGVSSTLWDHIFGTTFDLKKEKEDKEKVRELMY